MWLTKAYIFQSALTQHKNEVIVTVESYKQSFIINEGVEKDAPSTERATERLQGKRGDWFHA